MQTAHSAIVEAQETPPADINACHTAAKTCVHEYYKSWAGKCEGCHLTPLSKNLPDPRIRGLASPDD
jgi:hypothetical protein